MTEAIKTGDRRRSQQGRSASRLARLRSTLNGAVSTTHPDLDLVLSLLGCISYPPVQFKRGETDHVVPVGSRLIVGQIPGTASRNQALIVMFLFFSNGVGLAGSILVSVLLSVVLLYACSHG